MRRRFIPSTVVSIASLFIMAADTSSFAPPLLTGSCGCIPISTRDGQCQNSLSASPLGNGEGEPPDQRELSEKERRERATLAVAIEDRIFVLANELEQLVTENGGLENLSVEVKDVAVDIANQTKALQRQYDDLISGRPSELLDLSQLDGGQSEI